SRVPIVVARVMPVIVAPVVPAVVITLDTVVGPGMDIPPTIVGVVRVVMIGMAHQPRVTHRFRTLDIGGSDTREAEPDRRGTRQENVSQFHCDLLRGWSVAEAGESGWLHSNRRNATLVPDVKTAKNTAHLPAGEKASAVRMTTPIISLMARSGSFRKRAKSRRRGRSTAGCSVLEEPSSATEASPETTGCFLCAWRREWSGRESNPRPLHCERSALPTELPPHMQRATALAASQRWILVFLAGSD